MKKSEVLSNFFSSVCTHEPPGELNIAEIDFASEIIDNLEKNWTKCQRTTRPAWNIEVTRTRRNPLYATIWTETILGRDTDKNTKQIL